MIRLSIFSCLVTGFLMVGCTHTNTPSLEEEGILRAAEKMKNSGNLPTAISMYQQLHETTQDKLLVSLKLGQAYIDNGDLEKARMVYEAAIPYDRGNQAKSGLARCYLLAGKYDVALPVYQEILSENKNNPDLNNAVGVAYSLNGDHAKAQECFEKALSEKSDDPEIISNFALSLAMNGHFERAISLMEPLGSAVYANSKQKNNLAIIYTLSGQADKAKQIFSQTVGDQGAESNIHLLSKVPVSHFDFPAVEEEKK